MKTCPVTNEDISKMSEVGRALHLAKHAKDAEDRFVMMSMTKESIELAKCMRAGSVEYDMVRRLIGESQKSFGY